MAQPATVLAAKADDLNPRGGKKDPRVVLRTSIRVPWQALTYTHKLIKK